MKILYGNEPVSPIPDTYTVRPTVPKAGDLDTPLDVYMNKLKRGESYGVRWLNIYVHLKTSNPNDQLAVSVARRSVHIYGMYRGHWQSTVFFCSGPSFGDMKMPEDLVSGGSYWDTDIPARLIAVVDAACSLEKLSAYQSIISVFSQCKDECISFEDFLGIRVLPDYYNNILSAEQVDIIISRAREFMNDPNPFVPFWHPSIKIISRN